jgi:hypothetical protein
VDGEQRRTIYKFIITSIPLEARNENHPLFPL